jgi:hypothetical protein
VTTPHHHILTLRAHRETSSIRCKATPSKPKTLKLPRTGARQPPPGGPQNMRPADRGGARARVYPFHTPPQRDRRRQQLADSGIDPTSICPSDGTERRQTAECRRLLGTSGSSWIHTAQTQVMTLPLCHPPTPLAARETRFSPFGISGRETDSLQISGGKIASQVLAPSDGTGLTRGIRLLQGASPQRGMGR